MVDKNLIATLGIEDEEALNMLEAELGSAVASGDMESLLGSISDDLNSGRAVTTAST